MGKKGGSQTTEVKLPPQIEKAATQNLDIANEVAALGATPYQGPTIAGFSPQQLAGMQATDQAAAAFGMPSAVNWQQGANGTMQSPQGMSTNDMYSALTGMPPPNSQAGGFSGYSTAGMAQQAFDALPPAQKALIQSFVMDPVTGAAPINASVPSPKTKLRIDPSEGRTAAERRAIASRNRAVAARNAAQAAAQQNSGSTSRDNLMALLLADQRANGGR